MCKQSNHDLECSVVSQQEFSSHVQCGCGAALALHVVSFWVHVWRLLQGNPEVPKTSHPGFAAYREHYMQVLADVAKRQGHCGVQAAPLSLEWID